MTASLEPREQLQQHQQHRHAEDAEKGLQAQAQSDLRGSGGNTSSDNNDEELERWNSPGNTAKTMATFWAFLVMGANDAAYGVSFY